MPAKAGIQASWSSVIALTLRDPSPNDGQNPRVQIAGNHTSGKSKVKPYDLTTGHRHLRVVSCLDNLKLDGIVSSCTYLS